MLKCKRAGTVSGMQRRIAAVKRRIGETAVRAEGSNDSASTGWNAIHPDSKGTKPLGKYGQKSVSVWIAKTTLVTE
jgi:hypothetical protein